MVNYVGFVKAVIINHRAACVISVNASAFRQHHVNAVTRFTVSDGGQGIAFVIAALLVVAPARQQNAGRFFIVAHFFVFVGSSVVNVNGVKLSGFAFDKLAAFRAGGRFPIFAVPVGFKSGVALAFFIGCYKKGVINVVLTSFNMVNSS